MRAQIAGGLNYSLCGIPYWNTDIGGFFGWAYNNDWKNVAMQELQVRWMQWGCFMPIMRNHCSSPMESEIYKFGDPGYWAFDVQKDFIELRYRLLPVLYRCAFHSDRTGEPLFRGLGWEYPADKRALSCDTEYMLGKDILIAPVAGERMQKPKQTCYTAPVKAVFFDGTELAVSLPVTGAQSALDAMLAIGVADTLGVNAERIIRPSSVRTGMFCRLGFLEERRPVAVPVCRKDVWILPSLS